MRRVALCVGVLSLVACNDPAEFRPAKGVKDYPSVKTAYRVHEGAGCESLGFVVHAREIDHIAETVANHGGTHYVIVEDFGSTAIRTEYSGTQSFGNVSGTAISEKVKRHGYVAEAFRCAP